MIGFPYRIDIRVVKSRELHVNFAQGILVYLILGYFVLSPDFVLGVLESRVNVVLLALFRLAGAAVDLDFFNLDLKRMGGRVGGGALRVEADTF